MKLFIDYVHNNPGEAEFETKFADPRVLKEYGFNGQCFKNVNLLACYRNLEDGLFPANEEQKVWYEGLLEKIRKQNKEAKDAGLGVYYQIDPMIFPVGLVDKYSDKFKRQSNSIEAKDEEFVFSLYGMMLDEMFDMFGEIDGFFIRVGETYLFDSPYHVGGVPVFWGEKAGEEDREREIASYVKLIEFLREQICEKHGKTLIFRSWDCFADKMHSCDKFYTDIVGQISCHENLYFSVKHTQRDFWRYIEFNPTLGKGGHKQLVEIQSQREYEGKGAFANYSAGGVLAGFEEMKEVKGLSDIYGNESLTGIYHWSRGGGWHGPYLKNEFWCDLNTSIIAEFFAGPDRSEYEIFEAFCKKKLNLCDEDVAVFRKICLLSQRAVLKSIYCEKYDSRFKGDRLPAGLWFRDDRLGGIGHLRPVMEVLAENGNLADAIEEKKEAVELWKEIRGIYDSLSDGFKRDLDYVRVSIEYGLRLFEMTYWAWKAILLDFEGELAAHERKDGEIAEALDGYEAAKMRYMSMSDDEPESASLFRPVFWSWPGQEPESGLQDSIDEIRDRVR
jgi:hypothetical protein